MQAAGAVAELLKGTDARLDLFVSFFQQDEQHAVDNQRGGDNSWGVKVLGDPVVDQQADDADGQHRNQYFEPELEGGEPLGAGLGGGERVELLEVEHDHRQNGAQLWTT